MFVFVVVVVFTVQKSGIKSKETNDIFMWSPSGGCGGGVGEVWRHAELINSNLPVWQRHICILL